MYLFLGACNEIVAPFYVAVIILARPIVCLLSIGVFSCLDIRVKLLVEGTRYMETSLVVFFEKIMFYVLGKF